MQRPFSLRRTLYAPLMISLPVSLLIVCAAIVVIASGGSGGATPWIEALGRTPQIFVVSVCACWALMTILLQVLDRAPK